MLDYDKRFLLKSFDNLTFDGSSIRGFSNVRESDLRLEIDWGSFRWLPSDVFGPGKVFVFGLIEDRDGAATRPTARPSEVLTDELQARDGMVANLSVECEGFVSRVSMPSRTTWPRKVFSWCPAAGISIRCPRTI